MSLGLPLCLASTAYGQAAYTYEVVKAFDAQFPNGAAPKAPLVQAADGSFYGTTEQGGAFNRGTVFKIDAAGTLTTLRTFTGGDGAAPAGGGPCHTFRKGVPLDAVDLRHGARGDPFAGCPRPSRQTIHNFACRGRSASVGKLTQRRT